MADEIGKTPVECLQNTDNHKIPLSGAGILTFKQDPRYRDAQGRPRRIEWIANPDHVAYLTGAAFNKPGRPQVFVIAYDILGKQEQAAMKPQVEPLVKELAAKAIAPIAAKMVELEASIEVLRNQIKAPSQTKGR